MTQYGQRKGRKLARRKARRERARRTRALLRTMLEHAQAALVVRHVQAKQRARGETLDLIGTTFGVARKPDESDAEFRARIIMVMEPP